MNRYTLMLLCGTLAAILLCVGCREYISGPSTGHVLEMKGFNYTSFTANGFQQGGERNALGTLKHQTANNWVALAVFEYQTSTASVDIAPNTSGRNPLTGGTWSTTSTVEDIRDGVGQARANGMHIMLKPQVDLYSGEWRASIVPDAHGDWFVSYTAMMERYASLAQELNIEMLCLGTEYVGATQPVYTARWRSLIAKLRTIYSGRLTYAANWSGNFQQGLVTAEFRQIGFWDDLDYIGVDTYYPLTNALNDAIPAFDEALHRAMASTEELGSVSARVAKPVVITEIGIQSVHGALSAPWDYSLGAAPGGATDTSVQKFYYEVFIDAIGKQQWCSGMFWWHWESVVSSNAATNYTPENKPAVIPLRAWYSEIGM